MTCTPLTVSITRTVSPERTREFAVWARTGEDLLRESPGHLGSGWARPEAWHMLRRVVEADSITRWSSPR